MFMNFKTAFVLSLGLAIGGGLASCSDELSDRSAKTEESQQAKPNAELSLSADFGLTQEEEFASTENPRSFTLQVGRGGRNRPHILIKENDEIPAHLIFAYTDTDNDQPTGNPVGNPTVIADNPVAVTLKAKLPKDVGQDDNYWGLEALKQPINIPQIESLQNKAWFVMGVVGANWNATDKRLEFDPNSVLFDPAVKLEEGMTRKAGVPHTFAWKRIYFKKSGSMMSTSIDGVRFKPRGLFVRMNLKNDTGRGLYVPQQLRFPAGQGYSPKTSLKLAASLEELKGSKEVGFTDLSTDKELAYHFPRVMKEVSFLVDESGTTASRIVYDYKYYLGTMKATNPYIIDPQPETPYFWLWLGDVKPKAETASVNIELNGESLGTLLTTHKFALSNMSIPEGKPGYTVARTLKLVRYRPLLPLEFVARGNLVRPGYGDWNPDKNPSISEVGPNYGYAGSSARGLWNAGGTFSYLEVDNWGSDMMHLRDGFNLSAHNRFLPGVEDWRTAIPLFRFVDGQYGPMRRPQSDIEGGYYRESNKSDVFDHNTALQVFGTPSGGRTQAPIGGERVEVVRIRDWNGDGVGDDYSALMDMKANYARKSNNEIVGVRFINDNAGTDAERRHYFSAYRLIFSPYTGIKGNTGGLTVQCVYIGNERLNASNSVVMDELDWIEKIKDPNWWTGKDERGELIERTFPMAGFTDPGLPSEGSYARYMVNNVWWQTNDYASFSIHKDGRAVNFESAGNAYNTGDLMIRYFVTEPRKAFEMWGSRN